MFSFNTYTGKAVLDMLQNGEWGKEGNIPRKSKCFIIKRGVKGVT